MLSKAKRKLDTRVFNGKDIDDKTLRQCWSLRLDFLQLKISEAEDWNKFRSILKKDNTLIFSFWGEGVLQGYFTFAFNPVEHAGRKALLVHSKYYYVRPAYRGHSKITTAAWRLLPGIIWRYGFRQMYFAAFSFPTSYVSLSRTFGRVMTLQSSETPDWEKSVFQAFVAEQSGADWDEQAQLIRHQNVPFGEDKPPSASVKKLRSEYESLNPEWAEGASLPILMKFDWQTIKSVLGNNFRRMSRG